MGIGRGNWEGELAVGPEGGGPGFVGKSAGVFRVQSVIWILVFSGVIIDFLKFHIPRDFDF